MFEQKKQERIAFRDTGKSSEIDISGPQVSTGTQPHPFTEVLLMLLRTARAILSGCNRDH